MANLNSLSGVLSSTQDLHASDPQVQALQINPVEQPPAPQAQPSMASLFQSDALKEATNRDVALQAAAQQSAPNNNGSAAVLSALGAIGNLAGAATGKGSIGDVGLQLAEQMRQEARLQQESFYKRVRDEEDKVNQQSAARDKALNEKLMGDSLKPLLRNIKDPNEQAALLQLINSGQSTVARQAIFQRQQEQLSNQVKDIELQMKQEAHGVGQTKALQDVIKNNLELQDLGATSYAGLTPAKQREEFKKQADTYQTRIKPFNDVALATANVDQLLGGADSATALDKISRISGLFGQGRGSYAAFGTPEDKKLYTAVNDLVTTIAHEKFGSALTSTEESALTASLGRSPRETTLGNALRDPRAFLSTIERLKGIARDKLSGAESGLDPAVVTRLTEEQGRPTSSLQAFEAHLQANRDLGGYSGSLDQLPPALTGRPDAQTEWFKLTPIQKKQFLIQMRSTQGQ